MCAGLFRPRPGERSGSEQVAGLQAAAVDRVVRHQLGDGDEGELVPRGELLELVPSGHRAVGAEDLADQPPIEAGRPIVPEHRRSSAQLAR